MSPIQYENPQTVFDLLDRQFRLDENVLVELTKTFLKEFKTGLGSYNHPMAMMWVLQQRFQKNYV